VTDAAIDRLRGLALATTAAERLVRLADVKDPTERARTMRALGTSIGLALGNVYGDAADNLAVELVHGLFQPGT
jgi:hypothetical protein